MAIYEFQVSVPAFLGAQLSNLRGQDLCPPAPFTIDGFEIVVDHIEFGNNAIRHTVPITQYVFFEDTL